MAQEGSSQITFFFCEIPLSLLLRYQQLRLQHQLSGYAAGLDVPYRMTQRFYDSNVVDLCSEKSMFKTMYSSTYISILSPPRIKRVAILVLIAFALIFCQPAFAQLSIDIENSVCELNEEIAYTHEGAGVTHAYIGQKQARAMVDTGAFQEENASAEIGLRFTPKIAGIYHIEMGLFYTGILNSPLEVPTNWARVEIDAFLRNMTDETVIAETAVHHQNKQGGGAAVVTSDQFNPPLVSFDVDLAVGVEYAVTARVEAFSSGAGAESNFYSDGRGVTINCINITSSMDDTDGDGIFDIWEENGIDVDGDGTPELDWDEIGTDFAGNPISLDPERKDILVEIDYMDCTVEDGDCEGSVHVHRPKEQALQNIVDSFDDSPVVNPNGNTGVNLWVIVDEALRHENVCDFQDNCFDSIKAIHFGDIEDSDAVKEARRQVFRYNLWVHDKEPDNSSGGEAELGGNDFINSLGSWTAQVGSTDDQSGSFMHELGHSLNLQHGGVDSVNCKPNYFSVMNYMWRVQGLDPYGTYDYSREKLPDLNENSLVEPIGVQSPYPITYFGPPSGISSATWFQGAGSGPIDWDKDGNPTEVPAAPTDINFLNFRGCGIDKQGNINTVLGQKLEGAEDWSHLVYNFRESEDFEDETHNTIPEEEEMDAETAEEIKEQLWWASIDELYQYSAKIVCGRQEDPEDMRLARGFYATTINIHNPNDRSVRFQKKLALTLPPTDQLPGLVEHISFDDLGYDEALKTDCADIERRVFDGQFPDPYIEGFVIIKSPESLDVTGVYTSSAIDENGKLAGHSSIDVEQINERYTEFKFPDLVPKPQPPSTPSTGRVPEGTPGTGYCVKPKQGGVSREIRVTVLNQGEESSGETVTEVDFFEFGTFTKITPALEPGESAFLDFDIPKGCLSGFSDDCNFKVTVDAGNQQPESNELNNVDESKCISPAG